MTRRPTTDAVLSSLHECEVQMARLAVDQIDGDVLGMARELFGGLEHAARKLVHHGDRLLPEMAVRKHPVWCDYEARLRQLRAFLGCFL